MTPYEPVVPATPAAPSASAPAAPAAVSPQQSERERIYQQHFNPPAAPPAAPEPVVSAPVETVAAEPPVDPAAPPPLTTEQVLQSLVQKIGDLEQKLAAKPAPAPAPAAPQPAATPSDWLTLLSEGKRAEAEEALARVIAEKNAPVLQSAQQLTVQQINAERDMNAFTADIRAKNADIAEMEAYIAPRVQATMVAAMQSGKIPMLNGQPSPADYVTVYKEALTEELKQARNFYLRVRGVGAAQATTRQAEVVATPTLAPQAVATPQPTAPAEPEVETPQAYLARRQQRNAAFRGLATQ